MSWIPNSVSALRIPAGLLTAYFAIQNNWDQALAFALLGAFTDFIDGPIARKLNVINDTGARFVDPFCDFAFALGVLTGFTFYDENHTFRLSVSAVLIVLTLAGKWYKERPRSRFYRISYMGVPLLYCVCAVTFTYFYLYKALPWDVMLIINWAAPFIITSAVWLKWERFNDWLHPPEYKTPSG